MSIENILSKSIDRRDFLKESGKAAVGLAGLLCGCAPSLRETRQDVINQKWDCNPILPIPAEGCYTGTNLQLPVGEAVEYFNRNYGITPTFSTVGWGKFDASSAYLPIGCDVAIQKGVIPVVRYVLMPFKGYKPIISGKHDDVIKEFAHNVAKFEYPMVLIPFQLANDSQEHYPWAGYPPSQYKEAWIRMHNLFKKEGANRNTLWALKLKTGSWTHFQYLNPFPYIPPKEYFDIIGWAVNNHCKPEIGLGSLPFKDFLFSPYNQAARRFPTKPQMLWELSSARNTYQADWLDDALITIKNSYTRIKGVTLDLQIDVTYTRARTWIMDPTHTTESVQVVKKHFADPYFIGSALKK